VVCKALTRLHLLDLARRDIAQRFREYDIVEYLPLGNLAVEVGAD
jgi:hypothetical protein